jgi:tetratricopeptide (TPR) repeat protein
MKLLARILSHGFAITIVLLLAVGLIYRGELFPEYDLQGFLDIGKLTDHREESTAGQVTGDDREQKSIQAAGADSQVETAADGDLAGDVTAADAPQTVPSEPEEMLRETIEQPLSDIESAASSAMPEPVAESPEDDSAVDSVVPVPDANEQQRLEELPEALSPRMQESTSTAVDDLAASGTIPADVSDSMDAAATRPESAAVIPQATDAAVSLSQPQEKAYQLLAAAREAYWLRDYDIAESKYKELTRVEPDNPDGFGELGNMYFSQGQWDEAATAYYEAGVRLIGQGLPDHAEELVAVIRGLNSARADDLELKIKEARSTAD